MSKSESKSRYPLLRVYGSRTTFLTDEEVGNASAADRIKSIWPFVVGRVLSFSSTLKPREKVNFDSEDVAAEIWIALANANSEWTPERGRYITFAGVIIDRELFAIRDKARTVHSPRNSSCRMKEYLESEANGSISQRRQRTANAIRSTSTGIHPIDKSDRKDIKDEEPLRVMVSAEDAEEGADALRQAMQTLTSFEAMVIGRTSGLWGQPEASVHRISWETGIQQIEIRRAKERANAKVRRYLLAIGHPVALD